LRKCETLRSSEESKYLEEQPEVVKEVTERKKRLEKYKDRTLEKEDDPEVIEVKSKKLAAVISNAKHLIVYSGAGISTSAKIPDYRGSQGIWTLLQKGEEIGEHDLSLAEPTFTHMALSELHKRNILKYVVSQNCDGLHLRSGLPRFSLSEVHGNMYMEVCKHCKPAAEYWRIFDTTPLTSRFQHKTNRRCRICATALVDTIVHFGERGSLKWPLNWDGATKAVGKADVVLCLGSSLKVLKKYPWLWSLDRPLKQRPKFYIVNLQWTPKDSVASIKINGKCDEVMRIVMKSLDIEIPAYDRSKDPIFHHASLLLEEETHTASQPMLKRYIYKQQESSEMEDSNATSLSNSEKQILSTESDDSKSHQFNDEQRHSTSIKQEFDMKVEVKQEIKVEELTMKHENGKMESDEIFDLTLDDDDDDSNDENVKQNGKRDDVVDFEALIDNLDVKESPPMREVKEETKAEEQAAEGSNNSQKTPEEQKVISNSLILQNQNLIDMALLNNSLLTASLALAPASSTSREALTATALILNYNNQIINTLTNNLNLLPYGESTTSALLFQQSSKQQFCDKNNISKEVLEKDIEMVSEDSEDEAMKTSQELVKKTDVESSSAEQYYKQLLASYCKVINDNLPKWSDAQYAYSGLHTIVNLPPDDANLWKSENENASMKRLRSSTAAERKASKAECKFCWEHYEQMQCQFYKPLNREFKVTTYRNDKLIICECCDYTEDEEEDGGVVDDENSKLNGDDKEKSAIIRAGWFGKGTSRSAKLHNTFADNTFSL